MDPNETLRRMRYLTAALCHGGGRTQDEWDAKADELAQLFEALDDFLSRGGFPPEAWREGPDAFGEDYQPPELRPWRYDSAHQAAAEQAARVEELSAARPDADVEGRTSDGGLFEVWIRPKAKAPTRVENPHRITTYWTAFGWTWACACGVEGRSDSAPTQTAAYAYGERHIRHALRKAAASQ